ncbi:MAG TPA: hypothetical protein VIQ29_11205 [Ancylobacter sp.]
MPFNPYASRIHSRRSNRIALPVGFAVLLVAGIYMANGTGTPEAQAVAQPEKIVRLVPPTEDVEFNTVPKGNRAPLPELVRAIEPAAVYKPTVAEKKKPQEASEKRLAALPPGVERFDQCQGDCDTRDPMLVRASYPVVVDQPAARPLEPMRSAEAESSLFDLPSLPSPGEIVDRTVAGTQAAYGVVKQAVTSTIDLVR